jgi:hypothetical protein
MIFSTWVVHCARSGSLCKEWFEFLVFLNRSMNSSASGFGLGGVKFGE